MTGRSSSPQRSDKSHCAALGCPEPAPGDRPFCQGHWRKLPPDLRTAPLRQAIVYLGKRDRYLVETPMLTVSPAAAVARDAWLYGDRSGDSVRNTLGTTPTWDGVKRGFEALVPGAEA